MTICSQLKIYAESSHAADITLSLNDRYGFSTAHNFSSDINGVLIYTFDDEHPLEHFLKLEFTGKTGNNNLRDLTLYIRSMVLDDLDMTRFFINVGFPYSHNLNGSSKKIIVNKFGYELGCDGTVDISFVTPVYQWVRSIYQDSKFESI